MTSTLQTWVDKADAERLPAQLDRVRLLSDLKFDEGVLPAGSRGTIVYCYREGLAYEVEFTDPRHAVLTIEASLIQLA
jgi:hypothetical protein